MAGQAGWLEVYLTASTGQLTLEVRAPSDHPAQDVHLSLTATGPTGRDVDLFPGPCGPGCYSMHVTWQRGTTVLHVQVAARRWTGGALTLAVPWPPLLRNSELFTRVIATMRRQWAILVSGQVTSGPGATVHNVFSLVGDPVHGQRALWRARVPDVRNLPSSDGLAQLVIYLPGSHIWVHLWIATRHRLRREVIVAPGHLIQHMFSYPHR